MKKSILLGIVALGAAAATSYGQGYVTLDNYASAGPLVVYGAGVPVNGVSGAMGTVGAGLTSSWTVGLYFVGGTTGLSEAAGSGIPDSSLAFGTGVGSTVQVASGAVGGALGQYNSTPAFNSGSTLNTTLTLEIVVWDSADSTYANAHYRGHSAAFSMPTVGATSGSPSFTGGSETGGPVSVSAVVVPEPTTMALGGLGLAALLIARRKKA